MKMKWNFILCAAVPALVFTGQITAEEPGKLATLPDKMPASVEARVGAVEMADGLPTQKGIDQLYEIQDFQRATQLYQWAVPAIGTMGWHNANIANGATADTDWVAYDDYTPRQGILTPNVEVTYAVAFPNLDKTGPLVLEYPAGGIAGILMDYWQRPQFDYGLTGPERGKTGGKVLILGPGHKTPKDTKGFHVVRIETRNVYTGYRVLNRSEKNKMVPQVKLYPYAKRNKPPVSRNLDATKDYTQSHRRGLAYWKMVHELIQREPVLERDRFFYAMLRDIGIEKGKPFNPDARMQKILEDATLLGEQITKVIVYEKRFIGNYYRKDARWQFALVLDPDQREDNFDQLDERTDWFYEAIGASYAMITKTPGVGSIYLTTYRDKDGGWLDGGKSFHLHIPANPPMKQFWAVSVYDLDTRNLFRNESAKAEISSRSKALRKNADGSVDLYFGPAAPKGKEGNWVETIPGKYWFPYFRLYAPTEAYFDRSWPLPDIERVD